MAEKSAKFLVCTEGKKCPKRGSKGVLKALKREIDQQKLGDSMSAKGCKCLGECKSGPTVVATPDKVFYGGVEKGDAKELVSTHSSGQGVVDRLVLKRKKKKK